MSDLIETTEMLHARMAAQTEIANTRDALPNNLQYLADGGSFASCVVDLVRSIAAARLAATRAGFAYLRSSEGRSPSACRSHLARGRCAPRLASSASQGREEPAPRNQRAMWWPPECCPVIASPLDGPTLACPPQITNQCPPTAPSLCQVTTNKVRRLAIPHNPRT